MTTAGIIIYSNVFESSNEKGRSRLKIFVFVWLCVCACMYTCACVRTWADWWFPQGESLWKILRCRAPIVHIPADSRFAKLKKTSKTASFEFFKPNRRKTARWDSNTSMSEYVHKWAGPMEWKSSTSQRGALGHRTDGSYLRFQARTNSTRSNGHSFRVARCLVILLIWYKEVRISEGRAIGIGQSVRISTARWFFVYVLGQSRRIG